ncbi:hypothetical protein BDK51DRAFT_42495 [Blyttiomyces helicus]|uniref:Mediator of RNA polymerase II transcription subunit 8 n=1 Tax=Blyttiomyces helicus TaxID=388810 RepID=A0A4P9WIE8_9FUNG|nr:hypothetical protein BDK51DRAFT_42495 [Blyttiomyces helicus]|eukprot:RKO92649.1 hypothetical protein BDK51DRAFT_42495 [Blyttiomyces helicus]
MDAHIIDVIELATLRTKLNQLNDSLAEFLTIHPLTRWPDVLSQFNILIAKYESLMAEMRSPLFKYTLPIPSTLPQDDPDFLPRVLLRTKLIPDIEEGEETLRRKALESEPAIDFIDEAAVKAVVREYERKAAHHDDLVTSAIETVNEQNASAFKQRIPRGADDHIAAAVPKDVRVGVKKTMMWMSSGPGSYEIEREKEAKLDREKGLVPRKD